MSRLAVGRALATLGLGAVAAGALAADVDIRGVWHPDVYILKDGTRHAVKGQMVFAEREWSVVFLVTADGRTPRRGSGEAGTYTLVGDRLVFSHHYNLSGGEPLAGLAAGSFEMNLHDAAGAPTEACRVERRGSRMTIRFPSGNAMEFERAQDRGAATPLPGLAQAQVTFLYFNDVEAAGRFYGASLGFEKTFDLGWVKIFSLSTTSSVGLVDGKRGSLRPADEKPVMLSLVVDDVDAWFARLRDRGVALDAPPRDAAEVPVRAFSFRDPEGHTLEVFQWLPR
jgi:predicted enzyme related to lactoylglutathione lyase